MCRIDVVADFVIHSSGFQLVSTANIELEHIRTDLNSKQNELTQATSDIYNLKVCDVWI